MSVAACNYTPRLLLPWSLIIFALKNLYFLVGFFTMDVLDVMDYLFFSFKIQRWEKTNFHIGKINLCSKLISHLAKRKNYYNLKRKPYSPNQRAYNPIYKINKHQTIKSQIWTSYSFIHPFGHEMNNYLVK